MLRPTDWQHSLCFVPLLLAIFPVQNPEMVLWFSLRLMSSSNWFSLWLVSASVSLKCEQKYRFWGRQGLRRTNFALVALAAPLLKLFTQIATRF